MNAKLSRVYSVMKAGNSRSYLVLFGLAFLAVVLISYSFKLFNPEFFQGIAVESFGMLFDLLILGFLFNYFYEKGETQRKVRRYLEEIEDYRGWNDKEAMFRNAGIIRRLTGLGEKELPLYKCYLEEADLREADLVKADLQDANLQNASLKKANLKGAVLSSANLKSVNLKKANLQDADLSLALLWWGQLQHAEFINANCKHAKFKESVLNKANFQNADFEGAYMGGAWLVETDLTGARGLTLEMLEGANSLYKARGLPPDLERELKKSKPHLFQSPYEK